MTHRPSLSTALANFAIAPETLNIRTVGFLTARPYTLKETAPGTLQTFMDITRDFTIANLEAEIASSADSLLQRAEEYQTHGDAQISAVARHIVAHGSVMTRDLLSSKGFSGLTGADSVTKLTEIFTNTIALIPNITAEQKNTSGGLNSLPYPIDFSATLDGIEGFQFGNTVTTNYLPAVYQNNRVAFTVTKIDHTIQNNDWTTTVATICRLLTDNQNKSDSTAENEYKNIQGNIENSGITYQGNTSATTTTRTNVTTAIQ
jgi:hypothetical protein